MLTQNATMKLMIKSKWCSQRNSSGCNHERLWIVRGSDDVQGGLCQQNPPSSVISDETPAKNIFFNLWDLTACRLCLSSLLQTVWSPTAHRRVSSWCRPATPSPASTTPPTTERTRGGEWLERFLFKFCSSSCSATHLPPQPHKSCRLLLLLHFSPSRAIRASIPHLYPTTRLALDLNSHRVQVVEIHPSETGQPPPSRTIYTISSHGLSLAAAFYSRLLSAGLRWPQASFCTLASTKTWQ